MRAFRVVNHPETGFISRLKNVFSAVLREVKTACSTSAREIKTTYPRQLNQSKSRNRGFGKRGICGREIAWRYRSRRLRVDPAARGTSRRNLAAAKETRQLASWAEETSTIASRRGASSNTITEHLSSQDQSSKPQDFGAYAADAGYVAGERWRC